jgi:hypothetical protein
MLFLGAIKILPLVTQDNVEHGLCPIRRPVHPGTLKAVINKVAALPLNFTAPRRSSCWCWLKKNRLNT